MDCLYCRHLEHELHRLERIHARKLQARKEKWQQISPSQHGHLRSAENAAMLRLEIARAQLKRHERAEHNLVAGVTQQRSAES